MTMFPPHLKKRGTVGIVAPSRRPEPEWLKKGEAFLKSHGFETVVHPQCYLKDGDLAGTDRERAEALMEMFSNSAIDAIVCARGGTGANRMVDLLDFKKIKKNPKPFVGFSDITVLLHAITKRSGFVTYHGPMMWNFAHEYDPRTAKDLLAVIAGNTRPKRMVYIDVDCTRNARVSGVLSGGNLSLLQTLIDTDYDWSGKSTILFIEDVDEPLYKIDRVLNHFRLAGKLEGLKGVIVGEMVNCLNDPPYARNLHQIVLDIMPSDIPICFGFPCGHGKNLTTLPLGAKANAKFAPDRLTLEF